MHVEVEDLIDRLGWRRIRSAELVGEVGQFGRIHFNGGSFSIGVFIHNEDRIMDVLENFVIWNAKGWP